MAEANSWDREPTEVDFGPSDESGIPPSELQLLQSFSSEISPLTSKTVIREDSDQGYPLSPMSPMSPLREIHIFQPSHFSLDLSVKVEELEKTLQKMLNVISGVAQLSEKNENLLGRFERLRAEQEMDVELRHEHLMQLLQETWERMSGDKASQEETEKKMAEEVQRRVKEEIDQRMSMWKREFRHMFMEQQEEEVNAKVSQMAEAIKEAYRERDDVKREFKVTLVRLQSKEEKNAALMQRIRELEERCLILENENRQLKALDIVRQTHFSHEGQMLECFSCKQEYSTHSNHSNGCFFHPLPSMPFESWRSTISPDDLPTNFTANCARLYYYWACCNVLATRRPEGCCRGRHHQQWEMDIVMRQVLILNEGDAFNSALTIRV